MHVGGQGKGAGGGWRGAGGGWRGHSERGQVGRIRRGEERGEGRGAGGGRGERGGAGGGRGERGDGGAFKNWGGRPNEGRGGGLQHSVHTPSPALPPAPHNSAPPIHTPVWPGVH